MIDFYHLHVTEEAVLMENTQQKNYLEFYQMLYRDLHQTVLQLISNMIQQCK